MARDLAEHRGESVTVGGWLVTTRRVPTKRGGFMRFLTIEDRSGTVEAVLFPDVYRRFGHLIRGYGPYLLRGRVEDAHGAITLTVGSLELAPTEEKAGW